jgi:hypothetical protein
VNIATDVYTIIFTGNANTHLKTNLTPTTTYRFKYQATNNYGWGELSDAVEILAAYKPDKISTPVTTTIEGIQVKIKWDAPINTRGAEITSYTIKFKDSSSAF